MRLPYPYQKSADCCVPRDRPLSYHLMGPSMTNEPTDSDLLQRVHGGNQDALAELFARYRERLRRMVRLRLDRRLQGRVDPSDVLQEAYLDVARRPPEYAAAPPMPLSLG